MHPLNSASRPSASAPVGAPLDGDYSVHTSDALASGIKIEHPRFGHGVIIAVDTESLDHKITVQFANVDTKVLLLKFAKFKIINSI